MRCKVPAAWRPGLRHTRSAARGYPSCRGQDAANATRHCNTQPVCWPPREPSPPPAGSGPAGAPPPSRLPPASLLPAPSGVGLSAGDPRAASPGAGGQLRAPCPTDWGSACLLCSAFWEARASSRKQRRWGPSPRGSAVPAWPAHRPPLAAGTPCPRSSQIRPGLRPLAAPGV